VTHRDFSFEFKYHHLSPHFLIRLF